MLIFLTNRAKPSLPNGVPPSFLRSLNNRRPPLGGAPRGGGAPRRLNVRVPFSLLFPLQGILLDSDSFANSSTIYQYELNLPVSKLPRSQICDVLMFRRFNFGADSEFLPSRVWIRGFCSGNLEWKDEREGFDDDDDWEKGNEMAEVFHQSSADPAEVDRICRVIDDLFALDRNMEAVLDECGIQLTADLVVDVLQRFKHARKPAFRFFCWADKRSGFCHDSTSFNAMMSILGKARQFETMVSMLEDMGKRGLLTMETFTIAIRAFASAKERKKSVAVFELMSKYKFKAGVETFNCLLDSLGRAKLAKEAQLLFEKVQGRFTPNLQTYTVLLNGWCKAKNLLEAAKIWNEMVDRGFKPDVVAHNIMLEGLLKTTKKSDGVRLFEVMKAKGPTPDLRSYTILIRDLCKQGKMVEAVAYFNEMAGFGLKPDAAVYTCLITGFGNLKKMDEVYRLLSEMKEKGSPPDGRTYNALIKLLTNRRMPDDAALVYDKMLASGIQPTIHTYNMIMKACFATGKYEMGSEFWEEMGRRGCCPDENSYSVLIRALVAEGRVEAACEYVEEMINKGMRIPQIDYCKFVADFGRFGRSNVLEELAEKMRDSGKDEVSEVFARWADMAKRGANKRDPIRALF